MSLLHERRIRVEGTGPLYEGVLEVCARHGYDAVPDGPAPLYLLANVTRIVPAAEFSAPRIGTLCFHPSLLPRHRGRDAVYWSIKMGDTQTGITWFWVTEDVDAGPIAIQKQMPMPADLRPRDLYEQHLAPLGVAAFEELLAQIESGHIPRTVQDETLATYERARRASVKPATP